VWVTNWLLHSRAGGRGPDAQEGRRDIAGTRASLLCGLAITSAHPPLRQIHQSSGICPAGTRIVSRIPPNISRSL
jgi:hypothetical protein